MLIAILKHGNPPDHRQHLNHPGIRRFPPKPGDSGRYQTTSEVVREALRLLESQERERDEAFHQLKAKLEIGTAQTERGELIDGV